MADTNDFDAQVASALAKYRGDAAPAETAAPPTTETPTPDAAPTGDALSELEQARRTATEWENRFKGLQPVVQERTETAKALEARLKALEAEKVQREEQLARQHIAALPDEERPYAEQAWQLAVQATNAQREVETLRASQQGSEQALMQFAKMFRVYELSQEHGVDPAVLAAIDDFDAMTSVAQKLAAGKVQTAQAQRQQGTAQRAATGAYKFEGGSQGGSPPPARPRTMDEARAAMQALLTKR